MRSEHPPPRHGWFQFPTSDGVPHAMIAPARNPNPDTRRRIITMGREFLDTGVPFGTGPAPM